MVCVLCTCVNELQKTLQATHNPMINSPLVVRILKKQQDKQTVQPTKYLPNRIPWQPLTRHLIWLQR